MNAFEKLNQLKCECQADLRHPKEWRLGVDAEKAIIIECRSLLSVAATPDPRHEIMGIPYEVDRSLPRNRIVLKADDGTDFTDDIREPEA